MINTIAYHTHQGLGDLLVCSPIANFLSKTKDKKIIFFARKEYNEKIRRFLIPEIEILSLDNYPPSHNFHPSNEIKIINDFCKSNDYDLIRSGYFPQFKIEKDLPWDFYFYKNANVDYSVKTTNFYIQKNIENEENIRRKYHLYDGEDYAFVHDDPQRNLNFSPKTKLKIIKNTNDIEIADMAFLLENAKELHLMGSSLLCLADLLGLPNRDDQICYYYSFRGDLPFRGKEKWKIVK